MRMEVLLVASSSSPRTVSTSQYVPILPSYFATSAILGRTAGGGTEVGGILRPDRLELLVELSHTVLHLMDLLIQCSQLLEILLQRFLDHHIAVSTGGVGVRVEMIDFLIISLEVLQQTIVALHEDLEVTNTANKLIQILRDVVDEDLIFLLAETLMA